MNTLEITATEYDNLSATLFAGATLYTNEHEGSSLEIEFAGGSAYLCEADGSHWLALDQS